MSIFLIITTVVIGSYAGRNFYLIASNITDISKSKKIKQLRLLPLFSFIGSPLGKHKDVNVLRLSEILGIVSGLLLGLSFTNLYFSGGQILLNLETLVHFLIYGTSFLCLLYLSVHDLIHYSVPILFIKRFLFVLIIISVLVASIKFLSYRIYGEMILETVELGGIYNLIGSAMLVTLFFFVVKITNEKGMGEGDIDVNAILGLLIPWPKTLVFLLLVLIIGGVIGSSFALYIKKFRGVIIPFIPFILLGYCISIGFSDEIRSYIFYGGI